MIIVNVGHCRQYKYELSCVEFYNGHMSEINILT